MMLMMVTFFLLTQGKQSTSKTALKGLQLTLARLAWHFTLAFGHMMAGKKTQVDCETSSVNITYIPISYPLTASPFLCFVFLFHF